MEFLPTNRMGNHNAARAKPRHFVNQRTKEAGDENSRRFRNNIINVRVPEFSKILKKRLELNANNKSRGRIILHVKEKYLICLENVRLKRY